MALGNPCGSCGSTEVHDGGQCPNCGPATPPDLLTAPPPDPATRLLADAQQAATTVAAAAAQPSGSTGSTGSAGAARESVAPTVVIDEPMPSSAHLAPPAPRPDPYAQISNPLHAEWGQSARPVPSAPATAATGGAAAPEPGRARGVLVFLVVLVAIVAVAALGWLQRDRIGDAVDDVRRQLDEQTASAVTAPSTTGPVATSQE